ncbi:MAG: HEAT repeat domain-containing protein [Planctomycetota bacterium]|jgi:HEAT repeat protein
MRFGLVLLAALCACADEEAQRAARVREATALVARLEDPEAFARVVALGEIGPLLRLLEEEGRSEALQEQACLALGLIGGEGARARLQEVADGDRARALRRCAFFALAEPQQARAARADEQRREREAEPLVARLEETLDQVVALRAVGPLLAATEAAPREGVRRLACVALGRIGGAEARDRLLEVLHDSRGDPEVYGPRHLYAAVGLTLLRDPGTAIDLLLNLSRINPDDDLAARAAEGETGSYWTIDAQLCDALLSMGLWTAEEELIEQMRRRHYVRVLIDAHAVLRRHTGLALPFRYNGSYADREADAAAWLRRLRETRAERERRRPFDAADPRFRKRFQDMMDWLGGQSVNYRYIAHKVVLRVGRHAVPALTRALASNNPIAQRQAALMLGRIGDRSAAPPLRAALALADADARAEAIDALRKLEDTGAREVVRERLGDADAEVRAAAAHFLGRLGAAADVAPLRQALEQERSPATITALLCALLRRGDRTVVPRLLEIFVHGEQHDREAAQKCLEQAAGRPAPADAGAPEDRRSAAAREMGGWFR